MDKVLYDDTYHETTAKSYWNDQDVGRFDVCYGSACSEVTVLDTDYETYTVLWSCDEGWFGIWRHEYAWVLARNISFDYIYVEAVVMDATSLGESDFFRPDNRDCPSE